MKIADISHYQGIIDWAKARKELELAIFRASVGSNKDNNYVKNAKECGIPFGAYHYVKASTASEAETEAKFFYSSATVEGIQPLFFCADIEAQTASTTKTVAATFCKTLRNLGVKKVGLYISQSLYPNATISDYDFVWIPRYGKNTGVADTNYKPTYPCDLWQYTSVGSVSGISGNVDLNQLNGSKQLSWFTASTTTAPAPTVEKKEENNMAEKFSNAHFVEFCKKFVGRPYWYGTCIYKCTSSLLTSKTSQYPSHYTSSRKTTYQKHIDANEIAADCVGLN